jgi:hypothetical protein
LPAEATGIASLSADAGNRGGRRGGGRWRYRILQNQRGLLLATVLRASTDVVICTISYRLTTR